ncbi:hypothetical protein E2C01_016607 [Portunus trituberculatus]|uniref:Uncharacterized protein n=1 Tax=Portunus trituberculatus TaxID=210409 RepID=A0A5B7DPI9_PORTR|nr:hypothetical protein [Portunus trituberculatus]
MMGVFVKFSVLPPGKTLCLNGEQLSGDKQLASPTGLHIAHDLSSPCSPHTPPTHHPLTTPQRPLITPSPPIHQGPTPPIHTTLIPSFSSTPPPPHFTSTLCLPTFLTQTCSSHPFLHAHSQLPTSPPHRHALSSHTFIHTPVCVYDNLT